MHTALSIQVLKKKTWSKQSCPTKAPCVITISAVLPPGQHESRFLTGMKSTQLVLNYCSAQTEGMHTKVQSIFCGTMWWGGGFITGCCWPLQLHVLGERVPVVPRLCPSDTENTQIVLVLQHQGKECWRTERLHNA